MRHILDPADVAEANALAARLARTMRARLVRRTQVRRRGKRLDLRRTIHRNVSHGGTPIELAWRKRKIKPLRLVMLLDASGSMSLYTAFFVRFLHGVVDAFREAEAFVFHTRLAHVSPTLRDVTYVDLPTSHWPMWSRPQELAAVIGDVARGARPRADGAHDESRVSLGAHSFERAELT